MTGEETVSNADVKNMSVNFAQKQEERNLEKAGHSLASSENYTNMLNQVKQDSRTSTEARAFSDQLRNAEQERWSQSVDNGSAFAMVKDEKTRNILEASGASAFNLGIVKAGGRFSLQGIGENGERLNVGISEKEAQSFEENRQRVRSEALTDTLQNSHSLAYAENLSKSIGATAANSYLSEAQRINTDSAAYNNNLETSFIKGYAAYRYGADSPENVQKAMNFLNDQAIGSPVDQRHLQDLAHEFLNGRFGTLNATGAGETIARGKEAVQTDQIPLREQVQPAVETAGQNAGAISGHTFVHSQGEKLDGPNRNEVAEKAGARQEFFERERSGKGRIQTDVIGMAGQGLEKLDHVIGKIVGKPERPQQDVMDIGAPAPPGTPTPWTVPGWLDTPTDNLRGPIQMEPGVRGQTFSDRDRSDILMSSHEPASGNTDPPSRLQKDEGDAGDDHSHHKK